MKNDEHPHVIKLRGKEEAHNASYALPLRLSSREETTRKRVIAARDAAHDMARIVYSEVPASHGYRRTLSRKVAEGIVGKLAAFLLIPTMLVYPILPAYAAEDASSTPEIAVVPDASNTASSADSGNSDGTGIIDAVTGAVSDVVNAILPDTNATDTTSTTGGDSSSTDAQTDTASTTPPILDASDATSTDATTTSPELPPTGDASSTDATTTPPLFGGGDASSTATTTLDLTASSTESTASSTDEVATSTESVASSTEPVSDEPAGPTNDEIIAQKLAEKEDAMRASIRKEVETEFTKGCVTLDTVGYYCLKDHQSDTGGALAPSTAISSVTSEIDPLSSYKQIFMTRGGETTMITHDAWDNAFPSDDLTGSAIVWQGNVSGRWQIFFTDATGTGTPKAIQLTHSTESNFNPRVDGDDVVWQGWVDGNWEVFLAQHLSSEQVLAVIELPKENQLLGIDREWKVERITTNSVHDMFPSIAGELITWQSFQDNAWNIYAYSMKTHATTQLSHSGEKSEKPRFAITWDERSAEGAARMVGYDIATGKALDLTSEARQVNDERPYNREPLAPIGQPNQAALPAPTSTATSTSSKTDGDGASGNDLDV